MRANVGGAACRRRKTRVSSRCKAHALFLRTRLVARPENLARRRAHARARVDDRAPAGECRRRYRDDTMASGDTRRFRLRLATLFIVSRRPRILPQQPQPPPSPRTRTRHRATPRRAPAGAAKQKNHRGANFKRKNSRPATRVGERVERSRDKFAT